MAAGVSRGQLGIADLTGIEVPEQPALSPDGTQTAYVVRSADVDNDRTIRRLWLVGAVDGAARQLTRGPDDTSPQWSPDGTRLVFVRAQADDPGQLWLLPTDGGEPEQLTKLPLGAGAPQWSPTGTQLAFTAPVDITGPVGTTHPVQAAGTGEDDATAAGQGTAPVVADRLDYQSDGTGLVRSIRRHVHVLDLGTRQCRQVTDGDWNAGEPAWSPDGTRLAFAAGMAPDRDVTLRTPAHVLDLGVANATPVAVGPADSVAGPLIWTADGKALLVVGHRGAPVGHAGLLRVPLRAGEPADDIDEVIDLAAPLDRNVMPGAPAYPGALPVLTDAGRTVLFCVRDRGCSHLYAVGVGGGKPRLILGGEGRNVSGLSARGSRAALVVNSPGSFGEIVTVDIRSTAEAVRSSHGARQAGSRMYRRVEREFTISDGAVVQGWLMRRPDASGGRQPLLLDIHGGPHNAWNAAADDVHLYHQDLVARGWSVLLLNPRGSDGYGERFYNATIGAWGLADEKDFLEPLDALVAEGIADPKRLAVTGYSYGGFMTCYLTGRDTRFAAAVAGGLVSDLASMVGTSDEGHFISAYELDAPAWADPARYAAMSPLTRVDQVRTPTLIVHGAADLRCPVGQAQQWHTALREQGVPTRLVLYPGGSHLFTFDGPPSHRLDVNRRIVDWLERYAGDAEAG